MKKSAALAMSRSGGARNPHVFQYTLRLLVPAVGLAVAVDQYPEMACHLSASMEGRASTPSAGRCRS
ncbi:MAG: hypothetical protein ACREYE_16150 [Gammaproteobacteria bacterium]